MLSALKASSSLMPADCRGGGVNASTVGWVNKALSCPLGMGSSRSCVWLLLLFIVESGRASDTTSDSQVKTTFASTCSLKLKCLLSSCLMWQERNLTHPLQRRGSIQGAASGVAVAHPSLVHEGQTQLCHSPGHSLTR